MPRQGGGFLSAFEWICVRFFFTMPTRFGFNIFFHFTPLALVGEDICTLIHAFKMD